ncbi:hypothetical protein ACHAWO_002040 [Cyclotella atomus]|uniref:O-GlcNAc transferase C-terminal domain-containing protein n=1 Tax=Cyclotella atomus TaxID=382360 RepID=A0ABD3PQK0_9STRA
MKKTASSLMLCLLALSVSSISTFTAGNQDQVFRSRHTRRDVHQFCIHEPLHVRCGDDQHICLDDVVQTIETPSKLETLLNQASQLLSRHDANGAFALLAEAYPLDPTSSRIASMFQKCMETNVDVAQRKFNDWKGSGDTDFSEGELNNLFQDRMGLASLCIDKEQYDQAGTQLRTAIEEASLWLSRALLDSQEVNDDALVSLPELESTKFEHWRPQIDQARYLLYRTNAACCKWDTYFQDGDQLRKSLERTLPSGHVIRLLHPFDALKFPCISLELASEIAESYAHRALEAVGVSMDAYNLEAKHLQPRRVVTAERQRESNENMQSQKKLRIGYLSPDFTSRHPLAFLMQHVFRCHDKSRFSVHIYSLSREANESLEVKAIRDSSDTFTYLPTTEKTPVELYQSIVQDDLDILVDLCGYAGTSIVAEIMASRCKLQRDMGDTAINTHYPIHVAYMGFPGSMGSHHLWDYSIFDKHVIPPSLRDYYSGALVYMPHCYFVNSHKTVIGGPGDGIMLANEGEKATLRAEYGLHRSAFVYCCHSRPDKIDPSTFRSWMRALVRARDECKKNGVNDEALPLLWLLRSGDEIEQNLRRLVLKEFGEGIEHALIFADVAERNTHLRRLGCADVFLDTPAYGAHTLGVDALYSGVPMISLSQNNKNPDVEYSDKDVETKKTETENRFIPTDKLASMVGSSLLRAVSCKDLIVDNMQAYEDIMLKCATDGHWFDAIRNRLVYSRSESPLFDTHRWCFNLETAFLKMREIDLDEMPDIVVIDE